MATATTPTPTLARTMSSTTVLEPDVARAVRIHRFAPSVAYIPPRSKERNSGAKKPQHKRKPSRSLGAISPHLPHHYSDYSPCLCEQKTSILAPIDVPNVRRFTGANTPWLGSPSYTNFPNSSGVPSWGSPTDHKPVLPSRLGSLAPPPTRPPPTRAKSYQATLALRSGNGSGDGNGNDDEPIAESRTAPGSPTWAPARLATQALLSANNAAESQRTSWAGSDPTASGASTHTISPISPISPLAFEHADWPDFASHSTPAKIHVVDDDHGHSVSPISAFAGPLDLGWHGLHTKRPVTLDDGKPTRHLHGAPAWPFPPVDAAKSGPTAPGSSDSSPSPAAIKRKPVGLPRLRIQLPNCTANRLVLSPTEVGWRHTIACPNEDGLADPQNTTISPQRMRQDEGDLPTPRMPLHSFAAPLPRVTVEEVGGPHYGVRRRPSRSALTLGVDEPSRRRTIESCGIGIESEQWLDLQLALMGIHVGWDDTGVWPSIF